MLYAERLQKGEFHLLQLLLLLAAFLPLAVVVVLYSVRAPVVLFPGVYFMRYLADFAFAIQLDCLAAMTVKLREYLPIHGYCSHYLQLSLF